MDVRYGYGGFERGDCSGKQFDAGLVFLGRYNKVGCELKHW